MLRVLKGQSRASCRGILAPLVLLPCFTWRSRSSCTLRPPSHPSLLPPSVCRSAPSHHSPLFRQGNHRSPSCTAGPGPPSSDLRLPSLCCHFCQDHHPPR